MSVSIRLAAVGPDPETGEIVIYADGQGVDAITEALRDGSADFALIAPPEGEQLTGLGRLVIADAPGKLRFAVRDEELQVAGNKDARSGMADQLAELVEYNDMEEPGMHDHISWGYGGSEQWLAEGNPEVVVAGWIPD